MGEQPECTRTLWHADIPVGLAITPAPIVWTVPPEPDSPWAVLGAAADRRRGDQPHRLRGEQRTACAGSNRTLRSSRGPGRRWCAASTTDTRD